MKKKRLIPWLLCFLLVFATSSLVFLNQAQAAPTQTAGKAENYTGWKTISGQKYYYRNGKALKGPEKSRKILLFFWQRRHYAHRLAENQQPVPLLWQTQRNHVRKQNHRSRRINSKGVWTPVIVLDPGHSGVVAGGYEPLGPGSGQMKSKDTSGTEGVATGVPEYKLTLDIGLQLRTLLQKRGCKVIMTRTNSKNPLSCIQRAQVANKASRCFYPHPCQWH